MRAVADGLEIIDCLFWRARSGISLSLAYNIGDCRHNMPGRRHGWQRVFELGTDFELLCSKF